MSMGGWPKDLRPYGGERYLEARRSFATAVERVAAGEASAGPMAALDLSERFHWIASPSSTIIQPGPIHTGLTANPGATLERLFRELVLPVTA